jgi:hypothetical protein
VRLILTCCLKRSLNFKRIWSYCFTGCIREKKYT